MEKPNLRSRRISPARPCRVCGDPFLPYAPAGAWRKISSRRTCGRCFGTLGHDRGRRNALRRISRRRGRNCPTCGAACTGSRCRACRPAKTILCVCGKSFEPWKGRRDHARKHCGCRALGPKRIPSSWLEPEQKCQDCGDLYFGRWGHPKCKTDDRKGLHEKRKAMYRRARPIPLRSLYERDGGVCWLCQKPVPPNFDSMDTTSPTRDHVIPLVRGGHHTWVNVRLAHRGCNSRRGALDRGQGGVKFSKQFRKHMARDLSRKGTAA